MKIYPYTTPDGIIDLVRKDEHDAIVRELKKHLAEANKGARINAHINQSLAGKVNVWQAMAERLANDIKMIDEHPSDYTSPELFYWNAKNHARAALAAYESAKSGTLQMFTPCVSCEAPLVCSDLGNCYKKKGEQP